MAKNQYWDIRYILSKDAIYNMIIGERSNGKTYGVLQYSLEQYFANGSELAIIRRYDEDFKGKRGQQMFDSLVNNGVIKKLSHGRWNSVKYYSQRWYFTKYEDGKLVETSDTPFAYGFSLSSMEHDKSTSYPRIRIILFDEFLTREYYLINEFVLFQNVISTIVRERDDVRIFMCGNTVNKYSPYFKEMGLKNVKNQREGTIDLYTYGDSGLSVAVEYCDSPVKQKKSNKYFAFDNPKLKMITHGKWEIDIYPHLPIKYLDSNVKYQYFIKFDDEILHCKIIEVKNEDGINTLFTYIHRKTTPIHDDNRWLVYQQEYSPLPNYKRRLTKPTSKLEKKLAMFFIKEKVFYQDNDVGEVMRNYLEWSSAN